MRSLLKKTYRSMRHSSTLILLATSFFVTQYSLRASDDIFGQAAEVSSSPEEPAPDSPEEPPAPEQDEVSQKNVTLEAISAQLQALEKNTELDDKKKAEATDKLNSAKQWLEVETEAREDTLLFQSQIDNAPTTKKKLLKQLSEIEAAPFDPTDRSQSLDDLERMASTLKADLEKAKASHAKYVAEWAKSSERKAESSKRQEDFAKRLEKARLLLAAGPTAEHEIVTAAIRLELRARISRILAESNREKTEAAKFEALAGHQTLRSDLHQRTVTMLESQISQLNDVIATRRNEESRRQVEEARKEARNAEGSLRTIAEANTRLAEERAYYVRLIGRRNAELERIDKERAEHNESFNKIVSRIEEFGMSQATGSLLRLQRENLPNIHPLIERNESIEKELPTIGLALAEYKEQREPMFHVESLVDENLPKPESPIWKTPNLGEKEIRQMVHDLLVTQRSILDDLIKDLDEYSKDLHGLHFSTEKYVGLLKDHAKYIDEHVLWIRSADAITQIDVDRARNAVQRVARIDVWQQLLAGIGTIIRQHPTQSVGVFLFLALGLSFCDRLASRLSAIGQTQEVLRAYRFLPTVEAILLTMVLASFWPIVFAFFGWQLAHQPNPTALSHATGHGLLWTAMAWWALSLLRQISRPDGLGESHFGWHRENLKVIRSNVRWLITFGLPFVFLVMGLRNFHLERTPEWSGRFAFIAGMLVMSLFTHFMLNPYGRRQGIWAKRQIWVYRIRHVLHAVGVSIPAGLALLSAIGYIYSAFQLTHRAHVTLWLVLAVVLVHAVVTRYLLITRRRVAVKHMRQRQAQASEANGDQNDGPRPEESLDFNIIGDQLQRLLRAVAAISLCIGISFVWADMVPALAAVNKVKFQGWEKEVVVKQFDEGTNETISDTQSVPVTLGDVLFGVLMVGGTLVATRNLPGLLNITLFERLPIDFGTRYALTTVVRYVITLVGFVVAFRAIGFTWGSVQWLVAAMTVGLGFGLQEIFANFVSGLIILTERPIRVGDMITVSGVMGKVTRMQIRATTITDFDRRELVIPNKKFITEDVINWTLSDSITRVVCPVGIAYRCDPELARDVLMQVARDHAEVLDDPEPTAVFLGFGDSTLNLELRVFIVGREQIARIRDELNLAINSSFRNAKLEIAFPQRDLHIRSIDAVAEKLISESKRAA